LDVHRDFCEVTIVESGALRSAGRIATTPERLELFAQSLALTDRVALEVTGNLHNTSLFDVTGNPALSVPCGLSDGRPIGMMLVGRHLDDATVLRAGHAYEQVSNAAPKWRGRREEAGSGRSAASTSA
jgi:Asp-tRNA(Asn)/Glu-tRNA(Gln) amidotransferase A subunit family amidase